MLHVSQCQIKAINVFQITWERNADWGAEMTKGCVDWVFRSLFLPTGSLEEWAWGHCQVIDSPVLLREGASLSRAPMVESILATWNACQAGFMKSREAFYIISYCMPQLLFFLSFLFSLSSITLRFIISLLMPLQRQRHRREIKRTGKSSPLVFGHLHCIGFSLFPHLCIYF